MKRTYSQKINTVNTLACKKRRKTSLFKFALLAFCLAFSFLILTKPIARSEVIMEKGSGQVFGIGEEDYKSPFSKDSEGNFTMRSKKREKKEDNYNYPLIITPEIKWESNPSGAIPPLQPIQPPRPSYPSLPRE